MGFILEFEYIYAKNTIDYFCEVFERCEYLIWFDSLFC